MKIIQGVRLLFLVIAATFLVACGGGDGGGDAAVDSGGEENQPAPIELDPSVETMISGIVSGGSEFSITATLIGDESELLGATTSSENGQFQFTLPGDRAGKAVGIVVKSSYVLDGQTIEGPSSAVFLPPGNHEIAVNALSSIVEQSISLRESTISKKGYDAFLANLDAAGVLNLGQWPSPGLETLASEWKAGPQERENLQRWANDLALDLEDLNLEPRNLTVFANAHGGIAMARLEGPPNKTVLTGVTFDFPVSVQPETLRQNLNVELLDAPSGVAAFNEDGRLGIRVNSSNDSGSARLPFSLRVFEPNSGKGRVLTGTIQTVAADQDSVTTVAGGGARITTSDGRMVVDVPASGASDTAQVVVTKTREGRPVYQVRVIDGQNKNYPVIIRTKEPSVRPGSAISQSGIRVKIESGDACTDDYDDRYSCVEAWSAYFDTSNNHSVPTPDPNSFQPNFRFISNGSVNYCGANDICWSVKEANAAELVRLGTSAVGTQSTPPVILVHGYSSDDIGGGPDTWGDLPQILEDMGLQVYVFRWSTRQRFQDGANYLNKALRIISKDTGQKVHVVAHSFGGVLTRTLLQSKLDKVRSFDAARNLASVTTFGSPYSGLANGGYDGLVGSGSGIGCGQITCHQMGDDIYVPNGVGVSRAEWAAYLGIEPTAGALTRDLANLSEYPLPEQLPITVGVGVRINTVGRHTGGDGLISLKGQRFFSPANPSSALSDRTGRRNVEELLLGIDPYSTGYSIPARPSLNRRGGYAHTKNVSYARLSTRMVDIEADESLRCQGAKPGSNCHGTIAILKRVFEENSSSSISPVSGQLPAPQQVGASALQDELRAEWDFVEGADQYEVFIGQIVGISPDDTGTYEASVLVTGTRNSAIFSVPAGKTWFVRVRAINGGNPGQLSTEVSTYDAVASISGVIQNNADGVPVPGATVSLNLDGQTRTTIADEQGRYYFELPGGIDRIAFTVDADGFVRRVIDFPDPSAETFQHLELNVTLIANSDSIVYIDNGDQLFHLGDDSFGGSINSNFQRQSQGIRVDLSVDVPAAYLTQFNAVRLVATVKGAQLQNPIAVNGRSIGLMDSSPSDGSYQTRAWVFDKGLLRSGSNQLSIQSAFSGDYDDFEFINLYLEFGN